MKFNIPSLNAILTRANESARRFPETLLVGVICAVIGVLMNHAPAFSRQWMPHLLSLSLGIPLTFAVAMFASTRPANPWRWRGLGLLIGAAFLLVLDASHGGTSSWYGVWDIFDSRETLFYFRYWQFSLGLHLLVAFAPFIGRGSDRGFWQYNALLFKRFLQSAIYTITLQIGLSIALLAVDKLFNIKVSSHSYMDLWIGLSFVFNTWFFISNVPTDVSQLDNDVVYPTDLRIFTQYVLLPLVSLYFLILYLYIGKIVIQHDWPRGLIGYMVSGASILGIFSLLLIYPWTESEEHRWVPTFSRIFHAALIPLAIVLFLAVWKRTGDYGLTEKRYFLFIIAGWLLVTAAYFLVSRRKNIKLIPMTLCALAFATAVGPWSAYAVSQRWQISRLGELLKETGAFNGSSVQAVTTKSSPEQERQISGVVEYLDRMHGFKKLEPWFGRSLKDETPGTLLKSLGMAYTGYRSNSGVRYLTFNTPYQPGSSYSVGGYDVMVEFNFPHSNQKNSVVIPERPDQSIPALEFTVDSTDQWLTLSMSGQTWVRFDLVEGLRALKAVPEQQRYSMSPQDLTLSAESPAARAQLTFKSLTVQETGSSAQPRFTITHGQGFIFIKRK